MEKYSIILTVLFVMNHHYQITAEMTENRNISQQAQQWRSPVQTESQPNANNTPGHPSAAKILLETAPNGRPLRLQSITQQQKQARASTAAAAVGQQNVQPTMEYSNQMQTTTFPRLQIQVQAPATVSPQSQQFALQTPAYRTTSSTSVQPSSFLPPVSALPEPVPVAATFQSQPQFRPMASQQTAARPQFPQQLETQQMRPPLQSHRKMQEGSAQKVDSHYFDGSASASTESYWYDENGDKEAARREFGNLDRNGDGMVTKQEFAEYLELLEEQRRMLSLIASNFTLTQHDNNQDGLLSEEELKNYISKTLGRDTTQLPIVYRQYDRNADRKLDLNEFNALDFNFPWAKFPPRRDGGPLPIASQKNLFFGAGAVPPPQMNWAFAPLPFSDGGHPPTPFGFPQPTLTAERMSAGVTDIAV